jgi:hypothetical protein
VVGARAQPAIGQDGDLRPNDGAELGAVQEPCARPVAKGAGASDRGLSMVQ